MSNIPQKLIERRIYIVRGKKVMVDQDLAELYGVSTKALNQAVKRNSERFPQDFMFRFSKEEAEKWRLEKTVLIESSRSQFVTLKKGKNIKYLPYAFTEQGISMLSSVLKSRTAIQVNIQIMRTFTRIKELLTTNELIRQKIEELEKKYKKHDKQFQIVFDAIRQLIETPAKSKREIGFHAH